MRKRAAAEQVPMSYSKRGGARVGAGRPRKRDAGVPHDPRPVLSGAEPIHVTLRLRPHVWNLRSRRCFSVILAAFLAVGVRSGFRVVNLSIQGNHLHLTVEAANARALASGIHGLTTRIARGLNRLMGTRGPVFEERYHEHVLRTPAEVRRALAYIENNTTNHLAQVGRRLPLGASDPYTIGYFGERLLLPEGTAGMTAPPTTWLLCSSHRRLGVAPVSELELGRTSIASLPCAEARADRRSSGERRSRGRHGAPDTLTLPLPFPLPAVAERRPLYAVATVSMDLVKAVGWAPAA